MRLFIISVVILSIIIAGTIWNSIYMSNLTSNMLEIIENLPDDSDINGDFSIFDELNKLWEDNHYIVAMNTDSVYVMDITESIINAKRFYVSDNKTHYKVSRDHLYQAVKRLHELEKFSFANII